MFCVLLISVQEFYLRHAEDYRHVEICHQVGYRRGECGGQATEGSKFWNVKQKQTMQGRPTRQPGLKILNSPFGLLQSPAVP